MHPAASIIVFSTLSGAGYGLAAMLGLGLLDPARGATLAAHGLALVLIAVGLVSSTLHLGNPQRAWRALSQWRSSWLSREGVLAVLAFLPLGASALAAWFWRETLPLIGLLGAGPLSSTTVASGPLQLAYARFERRHAPTELEVSVSTDAATQDQLELWVSTDYLARVEITAIVPEPEEVRQAGERIVYRFHLDEQAQHPTIQFALEPDDPGHTIGRLGILDGPEVTFWQVVYP